MAQSVQVKSVGWWHERLADWMIANPSLTLGDAAQYFNCSRAYLSVIKNSDCFRIYWATKSGDFSKALNDRAVGDLLSLKEKAQGVAEQALDELAERLELEAKVMPVKQLQDLAEMGLKTAGYGARASDPSPTVNVNVGLVPPEALERARELANKKFGINAEPANPKPPIDLEATLVVDD